MISNFRLADLTGLAQTPDVWGLRFPEGSGREKTPSRREIADAPIQASAPAPPRSVAPNIDKSILAGGFPRLGRHIPGRNIQA